MEGDIWPLAFSAFDYERFLEQGYCAHLFAPRQEVPTVWSAHSVQISTVCSMLCLIRD
jgi:hypothetical protein